MSSEVLHVKSVVLGIETSSLFKAVLFWHGGYFLKKKESESWRLKNPFGIEVSCIECGKISLWLLKEPAYSTSP